MPEQWIALLIVGLVAGVAAGMFGIGGGVIIVPALVLMLSFELKKAVGTSLAALLMPVSIFAVYAYYKAGKLELGTAAWVAAGLVFGSVVGARVALGLDGSVLERLYGLFLLAMAWRFAEPRKWLAERRGEKVAAPAEVLPPEKQWWSLLILGLVAGVLAGMFGIGGGVIIVTVLVSIFHFDQKAAVGTSLAALLLPVSVGGVLEYYNDGLLDIPVALLVAAGLVGGSIIGAKLALGMSSGQIKRLYGVFLFFVGLYFLLQIKAAIVAG